MTIKDILMQYPYMEDDARDIQNEMYKYLELQEDLRQRSIKAQRLTGMPGGSGCGDPTYEAIVILIDQYQANIDNCIKKLQELDKRKKWLDKAFTELTEEERRVILLRYNKGVNIRKIAYIIHRGKDSTYKMLRETEDKIKGIAL
jgi:DNA-directed RNA polymerase sigma subunit (sigma70/sigma32)